MATATVLPSANTSVLEDNDGALLPESKAEAGEEFVELIEAPATTTPVAPVAKPAAPAAAARTGLQCGR